MTLSVFDLFSIGIGPSSSHTVGPMRAACAFVKTLETENILDKVEAVQVILYGSLALTLVGHATDKAILLGLNGWLPQDLDPNLAEETFLSIKSSQSLSLLQKKTIPFVYTEHFVLKGQETLAFHPNGIQIKACDANGNTLLAKTYFSVGGGFIVEKGKEEKANQVAKEPPFPFHSAKELMDLCEKHQKSISGIVLENEKTWRTEQEIEEGLLKIWQVMNDSIERGMQTEGILPGGLNVRRRAKQIADKLKERENSNEALDQTDIHRWLNVYAMAVNEENAAGSKVVTAPTNGAAGIIPSVIKYQQTFVPNASPKDVVTFLLTAGAIGMLYKELASISGAEVGCQGEVGTACSMAAAGLAEVLGGNIWQVENAAEVAMEHHLGLTCDPIMGLVQIPCIERNALGAERALSVAKLALLEDGQHIVSLDTVIATMKQTGKDMHSIYKETSQGGLAVNHPEC